MTDQTTHTTAVSTTSPRHLLSTSRRQDLVGLALLAAAVLLFFWPVVSGQAWLPRGGGDSVSFLYPMYRFAADALRSGTIPLWNPHQYAGQPFLADNQSGIFYPINTLLFLLWPNFPYTAVEWLVVLHVWLAGAFTYLCLRHLTPSRPLRWEAAALGGLAWMFSDVFVTHVGNLNLIAVAAWLPLAFLGLRRACLAETRRARLNWAVGGGVALGIGTLAGHGQMTFLLAAFLGGYAVYHALAYRQIRALGALALLVTVAVGLAAVSLFPAFEGVPFTVRAGFSPEQAANYALPWRALTGLFAPDFFGRGEVVFWGNWPRVEYGYAGVLTLLLAAVALVTTRNRLTLFFALATAVSLLLALGPNGGLYPLLLRVLPFFPFQVPARFVLLLDFCLAALAAFGLDSLLRQPRRMRGFLIGAALATTAVTLLLLWQTTRFAPEVPHHAGQMLRATAVFALLALAGLLLIGLRAAGKVRAGWFAALAIGLLALDLIALGRTVEIEWNDPMPGFASGTPGLAFVQGDPGLHRIDIATGAWQPNLPQMEGLYAIRGVYNPLELSRYAAYIGSVGYRGSPLYNLLGTKYVIGGKKEPPADTGIIVPVFDDDPNVTIYLNTLALPRAQVVYNAEVVADADAAFEAIHRDDFDPQRRVILEAGAPLVQEPGQSRISVLAYDLNRVKFEVATDRAGYFVLSDIYHPHWKTAVDGQAVPLLVADYALRAVALEPGTQVIEMWFAPPGWRIGLAVTLLTLTAVILWLVWQRRARRQPRPT